MKLTQSTAWEQKYGQANRWISFQNRIFHLYKSVLFTQQRPRRPETGIKGDFDEKEHECSFEKYSIWKNRTSFSYVPLLSVISAGTNKRASRVPFAFQTEFLETSCLFDLLLLIVWVFINYFSKDWSKFGKHAYRNKTCWERETEKKKKYIKIFLFSCALFKFLEGLTIALDASDPASKYYLKNPTSNQQNQEQRH